MTNELKIEKLKLQIREIEARISELENQQGLSPRPINITKSYELNIPKVIRKKDAHLADYMKGFGRVYGKFVAEYNVPRDWLIDNTEIAEPVTASEILESHNKQSEMSVIKESGTMLLHEAILKSNPGDEIHGKGHKFIMVDSGALYYRQDDLKVKATLMKHDFMKKEWITIPSEPNVLTADQAYYNDYTKKEWPESDERKNGYYMGFNQGQNQGRLEQWLNHKELREAVVHALDSGQIVSPMISSSLNGALKNIKPLNPDE